MPKFFISYRRENDSYKPSWTWRRRWRSVAVIAAILMIGLAIYGCRGRLNPTNTESQELPDRAPVNLDGYVWIKPGTFMMGSPQNEPDRNDDETEHRVTLTEGFYLGEHEVTQAKYEEVMNSGNPSTFKGATLPVESVTWNEAIEYCRLLTQRDHASGKLPDDFEYTLPTEAQWEFACRADSKGAYCFGDDESQLEDYAWYEKNADAMTHPVGEKRCNDWRLFDMHGNVWEWCRDRYGDYSSASEENPVGPLKGSHRVYRGGCWGYFAWGCRSADRDWSEPGSRYGFFGFRVAAVPSSKTSH